MSKGNHRAHPICMVILVLGVVFLNPVEAAALVEPAQYTVTQGQETEECISCPLFVEMDRIKSVWATKLFNAMAIQISGILGVFLLLYLKSFTLLLIMQPSRSSERFQRIPTIFLTIALVSLTLIPSSGTYSDNSPSVVWNMLIGPFEAASLELGKLIVSISGTQQASVNGTESHYALLAASIEGQIWNITDLAGTIMFGHDAGITDIVDNIERMVAGLILLLPYLFVMGIFFAFLLESLFKYISITMVAPLVVFSMIWTKVFAIAAARVILSAALTIIFASGAMSLTVEVVNVQGIVIQRKVEASEQRKNHLQSTYDLNCSIGSATSGAEKAKVLEDLIKRGIIIKGGKYDNTGGYTRYCSDLQNDIGNADSITVFQKEYFMLVIIGFVSILLHLGSKALASNISGAQESAGPAAAVTSGLMASGGLLWGASKYGSFMAGRTAAKGVPAAFSGASHALGSLTGSLAPQSGFSGLNPRRVPTGNFTSENPFSSGMGGMSGPNMPDIGQQMTKLSEAIDQLSKHIQKGG